MTTKFVNSMNNTTYTENNALSNKFADLSGKHNGIISLFYKTIRGINNDNLNNILEESSLEDLINTFIIAIYIRDCRGGKGERDIGRKCLLYLAKNYPTKFIKIIDLIPEYGRFDDLIELSTIDSIQEDIFSYIDEKLTEDIKKLLKNEPISLLGKWLPTEGLALDKNTNFVKKYCKFRNITPREYRIILSKLRKYINIIERFICNNNWENIEYSKVPSCALRKLRNAFLKHDKERFEKWQEDIDSGKEKVNSKQLFIHELIKDIIEKNIDDKLLEEQWKVLVNETKKLGIFGNSLVICDVSGSMNYGENIKPIYASIGLGLLISSCVNGPLKHNIITFSRNPVFVNIKQDSLYNMVNQLQHIDWGMNTDIQQVFNLILTTAKKHNLLKEDMPNKIYILSDMQFDQASCGNTNYNEIKEKYKDFGYDLPNIIFWNLNGSYGDFPVTVDDNGTVLISGYNTSIMKYILSSKTLSIMNIINEVLDDERYKKIKERLT